MYKRLITPQIKDAMEFMPVVYLDGARQVGKTTLLKSIMEETESEVEKPYPSRWTYYDLDNHVTYEHVERDIRGAILNHPEGGIVIDEVQRIPMLILPIKEDADRRKKPGRFLLSGSADPDTVPGIPDSLAGRRISVRVSTLSESEIHGTEPSFLSNLLEGKPPESDQTRIRDYLLDRVYVGCYPNALAVGDDARRKRMHRNYVSSLVRRDIKGVSGARNIREMHKLAKACMLSTANIVNFDKLGKIAKLHPNTVKSYLAYFEMWYLVELLESWHVNELKRIIKSPKLHVMDTGLACSQLRLGRDALAEDQDRFGRLVETFVYCELRKQATYLADDDLSFYHFRDVHGHEVDIVIENEMRECFAIEVKSGASLDGRDFKNMHRFKEAAGDRFKLGVILYDGDLTMRFGEGMYSAPLASLWA